MEHENLARLRAGLRAFGERDLAGLREIFGEDVIWHYGGTSVLAGLYVGFAEVFELFARRAALSEDTYAVHLEQAIANDEFITVLMRCTGVRNALPSGVAPKRLEQSICYVYRLVEGKVVEAWGHPSDPEAERAFYE